MPLGACSSRTTWKRPLKIINDYRYQPRRPAGTHAYMVSNKGARKLLELCKKASYHVDLDAWRHPELDITMFQPMLAYQTFEHTSLTDVKKRLQLLALWSTGPMGAYGSGQPIAHAPTLVTRVGRAAHSAGKMALADGKRHCISNVICYRYSRV